MNDIRFISTIVCVLCAAVMLLSGCADPEGPVGANVGDNGIGGEAVSVVITADKDTSLAFPRPQTSRSSYLYVGSITDITANGLIKFSRPLLPEEWTLLDSSRIDLYYNGGFGADDNPGVNVTLLDFNWSEQDTITIDQLPSGQNLQVTQQTTQIDSGAVTVSLDYNQVLDWLSGIDTTRADSSGLTIRIEAAVAANRIIKFNSSSSVETTISEDDTTSDEPTLVRPRIYMYITTPDTAGELDTLELIVLASDDVFLIDYDITAVSDTLLIGSGSVYRSFVHFDLSVIDDENYYNVINKAVLTLNRFPIETDLPITPAMKPYNVLDSLSINYRDAEIKNITNASTAIETAIDQIGMTVTNGVSSWINGRDAGGWFILVSVEEETNIDRAGFYGSDADSMRIPKLTIDYKRYKR